MLRFYECSAAERATYLTRLRSAAFVKRVNDRADAPVFNDKNTFSEKFRDLMGRETFDLRTGTFAESCIIDTSLGGNLQITSLLYPKSRKRKEKISAFAPCAGPCPGPQS